MQISVAPNATASLTRRTKSARECSYASGERLRDAEAAERAADRADVRDVDVAVDDERHEVAGQLGAQLVGRLAHVLDHLGAALGEHRLELLRGEEAALAGALDRLRPHAGLRAPRREGGVLASGSPRARAATATPRSCTAGRRTAARSARRCPPGAGAPAWAIGNGCSGEMWSPLARQPAEVGRAGLDQLRPPVGEVRAAPGCRRPAAAAWPPARAGPCRRGSPGIAHFGASRCGASERPVRQ